MKKLLVLPLLAAVTAIVLGAIAGSAAAPPKATGGVGYTAYTSVQRHAEFNAITTSPACAVAWNVTGSQVVTFLLDGDLTFTPYAHDAILSQTGTSVTGTGGYPVGGPYTYSWHITLGTVSGTSVHLEVLYDTGAPGTVMTMDGTIAGDGSISGTWTDDFGGIRTGTWSAPAGTATAIVTGCTGKGMLNYSDADGFHYKVDVQYVSVSGADAWFAGPVVSGNIGAGNWLFAKVSDGGEPGAGVDKISGSFATQAAAKLGVALMTNPADGPFTISSGNLQVH